MIDLVLTVMVSAKLEEVRVRVELDKKDRKLVVMHDNEVLVNLLLNKDGSIVECSSRRRDERAMQMVDYEVSFSTDNPPSNASFPKFFLLTASTNDGRTERTIHQHDPRCS